MAFKAQVSLTDNSIKEKRSVLFIENLLVDKANTDISTEDKKANIDGYIELLSSDKRIVGKITVQVKTVPSKYEGKNSYPCPTSLFAYAESTTDVVYLLAVDHSQSKVLFKHISYALLEANRSKEKQDSITLHFSNNEELRQDNIQEVLTSWLSTCNLLKFYLVKSDDILKENNVLKNQLSNLQENKTTLSPEYIKAIQRFSDTYNDLLNTTFLYIKETIFPNTWKRGIAIYEYTDSSLEYSLYNIKNGELLSPIVQLPQRSIFNLEHNHDFASFSCSSNNIKENAKLYALEIVKKHVDDFVKKQRIIPFDEEFLKEYVHDFVEANRRSLHIDTHSELNVGVLLRYFQTKYPNIEKYPTSLISGGKSIYLNTIYDALKCLLELGYETIPYPYPPKGNYGNTGMVYDYFSSSGAFEKSKLVIMSTIRAYQNFIQSEFPLLATDLDAFYGGNMISVFVDYSNPRQDFIFQSYYFKSEHPSDVKIITIEEVRNSRIMKENKVSSPHELFIMRSVMFNGKKYLAFRGGGLNDMTILFGKYNCLTYFYELLKDHFNEYFKKNGL